MTLNLICPACGQQAKHVGTSTDKWNTKFQCKCKCGLEFSIICNANAFEIAQNAGVAQR